MQSLVISNSAWPMGEGDLERPVEPGDSPRVVELTSAGRYTSEEIAAKVLPKGGKFARNEIEGALEDLTEWCLRNGRDPTLYRADVAAAIWNANGGNFGPLSRMEMVFFVCRWILPRYDSRIAGFELMFFDTPTKKATKWKSLERKI